MCPYIQSEIDEQTHRRLQDEARRRKTSLKAVIREALEDFAGHQAADGERDPFWDLVGQGDLPAGNWSEKKNWRFPELD